MAAEHGRDTHHSLLGQLAGQIAAAEARADRDLADRFQAHRDELAQHSAAIGLPPPLPLAPTATPPTNRT